MSTPISPERAARMFLTPDPSRRASPADLPPARLVPTPVGQVAVWCEGQGPVVLLVHGWSGRHADMAAFVAPLVAEGLQVVSIDLPAHGQSDGDTASMDDMAAAICAIADATGPVRGIIAHSVGCAATATAFGLGMRAGRTVFVSPPARYAYFARAFSMQVGLDPELLSAALRSRHVDVDRIDLPLMVPAIDTRALVIHSSDDQVVPFENGEAIAAAWPGARFVACEGLGHRRILADPRVVGHAVALMTN